MISDITLGQYFPAKSPLHRADPRMKICLVIYAIVLLFAAAGVPSLPVVNGYLEGAEDELTVVLSDELGRSLARFPVDFHGERLVLALEEAGTAAVQPEGAPPEGGGGA